MKVRREVVRQLQFRTGAGVHQKTNKAKRRQEKVNLGKSLY